MKRAAAIVMGGMIVSRILGYVRYKVIFYYFGRSFETEAFFGAFLVPDMVYMLVSGGAMTASFIPVYSELLKTGRDDEAWRLMSALVNITMIVVGFVVGLGIIFAPQMTAVIVPGFADKPATFNLCVQVVRIIFPMVVLTSLSAVCNGVLHSHNHFHTPALAWCLHNVGIIGAALLFHDLLGIKSLTYGVLAGALSMVLVQVPAMFGKGMKFSFTLGRGNPEVKRVLKLFLPAMVGLAISQINMMILPLSFGSFMSEGAVSALQGGERLLMLPLGIFGSAISMAIFPTLSRYAAAKEMKEFKSTFVRGISSTFVFSLPSMVVFLVLAMPVTRVLFGGGEFDLEDCRATALAIFYFAVGLPGHTAVQVVARGFYSLKDTRTPFYVGLVSVFFISVPFSMGIVEPHLTAEAAVRMRLVTAACHASPFFYLAGIGLLREIGFGGMALSVSLASLFNTAVLLGLFKRKMPDMDFSGLWAALVKVSAASAAMAVVCYVVMAVAEGSDPLIQLLAGCGLGGLVFLAAARILKVAELDEIIGMVKARFGRK